MEPPTQQMISPSIQNNNNNMTEISSTHTTMKLKLKESEKKSTTVTDEVPSRANFKRSNTCGSFFANCQCREHHASLNIVPLNIENEISSCDNKSAVVKSKRIIPKIQKNLSFTHPDTPVIFTEENRYPDLSAARQASREIFLDDGNQKIEIKHSKRASSPNLGATNYDVNIHPEFKIQVVPKSPTLHDLNSNNPTQRKISSSLLKKNSKSFPSVSSSSTTTRSSSFRSFDSDATFSSYSVDEESEDVELCEKVSELLTTDLDASSTSLSSSQSSSLTTVERSKNQKIKNTAEDFFQVKFRISEWNFISFFYKIFSCFYSKVEFLVQWETFQVS
jgi:hypothetical protein